MTECLAKSVNKADNADKEHHGDNFSRQFTGSLSGRTDFFGFLQTWCLALYCYHCNSQGEIYLFLADYYYSNEKINHSQLENLDSCPAKF